MGPFLSLCLDGRLSGQNSISGLMPVAGHTGIELKLPGFLSQALVFRASVLLASLSASGAIELNGTGEGKRRFRMKHVLGLGCGFRNALPEAIGEFRSMSDAGLIDPVLREKSGRQLRPGVVRIVFLVGGNWIIKIPA
jgi:hypothetical protein